MAGIGFELRATQEKDPGLFSSLATYTCAALISSGPWIITTVALSLLSLIGPLLGDKTDYTGLRSLITYAFAFSLITVGFPQMALTRRVADLLYEGKTRSLLPAFTTTAAVVAVVQAALGTAFCVSVDLPWLDAVLSVALYVIVSVTWVALMWLSVTRDWRRVLQGYLFGCVFSILAVLGLGLARGASGMLAAYTVGQGLTLVLLVRAIVRGLESGPRRDLSILTSIARYPALAAAGLFYSLAIWVDKLVFWTLDGIGPHPWIKTHPLYESASFLAYLTVVPALAVNLVHLETSFYEHYRGYFGAILGGRALGEIEDRRKRMLESLRTGTFRLLRVQGAITAVFIVLAPHIVSYLEMPEATVRVFRLCCVGALFHVLLSITILVQMYFDLRVRALASSAVFCVANAAGAWWSVQQGVAAYGAGYAAASLVSLVFAFGLLNSGLRNLEFQVFHAQPLGSAPREDEEPGTDEAPREAA